MSAPVGPRPEPSGPDHARRSAAAYGRTADRYASTIGTALSDHVETAGDLDRLHRFARSAAARGGRAVDLGCGTGRIARLLADHGVDTIGVDVADAMVDIARRAHPDVPFVVGELGRLPIGTAHVQSAVLWYSIITTPAADLPITFGDLARILTPGGLVLVGFPSGDGSADHRSNAFGSGVDLTVYRHDVAAVHTALLHTELEVIDAFERTPARAHEDSAQAFLTARRRSSTSTPVGGSPPTSDTS